MENLPCELHGVIYSFLDWKDKLEFISISREIYFRAKIYRELFLKAPWSLQYAQSEIFRETISTVISPSNLKLYFSYPTIRMLITDPDLPNLSNVHTICLNI
jgi:hypothetical protein